MVFARERLGLDHIFCGRIEHAPLSPDSFDLVTLWDVIEHIADPDPLLSRLAGLLRSGGTLFLLTPNSSPQLFKARLKRLLRGMQPGLHYLEAQDHLKLYSPAALRSVLRRNGFDRIGFTHLRPIQSVAGSSHRLLRTLKNGWHFGSVAAHLLSAGRVNLNHGLYVVARKG